MINLKSQAKKLGIGLLIIISIYLFIILGNLNRFEVWYFMLGVNSLFVLKNLQFDPKKYAATALTIAAIVIIFGFFSTKGVIGVIIILVLACLYILLKRRKELLNAKYTIESMVWGKPLKEFIKNKEQLPKIKLTLKKSTQIEEPSDTDKC